MARATSANAQTGVGRGRYTAGYHPETGKRIIKNVLGKTQAECKAKLKKAIEEESVIGRRPRR